MDEKRKGILLAAVLILLALLPAFRFAAGLFSHPGALLAPSEKEREKAPYEQPGSLWVCEEPEISMQVGKSDLSIQAASSYVIQDGEKLAVDMYLQPGSPAYITPRGYALSDCLLRGEIRDWSSTEVTITVEKDELFGGAYESITLTRAEP